MAVEYAAPQEQANDVERVRRYWDDAELDPRPTSTEFRVGGVNLRVDLRKAFKAVYRTAELGVKAVGYAAAGPFGAWGTIDMAASGYGTVVAVLDAVREPMGADVYVASCVLAAFDNGLTQEELKDKLRKLIDTTTVTQLPWYLGLTEGFLEGVAERFSTDEGLYNAIEVLVRDGWAESKAIDAREERLFFKERHFSLGVSEQQPKE